MRIAGYLPETSLLLFPACCPGDRRHLAAGGCGGICWCLPLELKVWRSHADVKQRICPQAQSQAHRYNTVLWVPSLLSLDTSCISLHSVSFFVPGYMLASLTLFFSRSPALLSVFSMIMLLSRSLLSECSLVELIFGWYYITASFSSQRWLTWIVR